MEASPLSAPAPILLVVDDDPLITDLFRQRMTKQGFTVWTAASGADALAQIQAQPEAVALVITDMTMPEMDGRALAEALFRLTPDVPVLISTGHDAGESLASAPPNVVGVVQKPFQKQVLVQHIREILRLAPTP